ncbi:ogr/Delta-like zinc finger family protein [Alicycliphilus denitrificans]|uniref:ogr/Delta-like zinc finger family protein n=1 Tax=Alicycliphilus denitrificans TaxID=179636 RepID=UPI0001DA0222|nr:ogr/Delta-like zinc finger family protein [Alicycliphilus denitrificans]ADU99007.1 transcriptional activator Ogr/delta [Alicycliphilus denitrificans BC]
MLHSTAEHEALQAAKAERARTRHTGRKLRYEGTRMACPMCAAQCEIRTSLMVSKTMRETAYQCTNVECGCTFVVGAEILRLLNPGATPDPKVNIPLSTHVRRDMVRVVLDNASEAEHTARFTTPVTGDLFAGGADTS